jgi:hypothetical protein
MPRATRLANYAGPLNYLEQLDYAGVSVLLLAIVGLAMAGRSWRPWFFAGVVVAGCLAIYGAPGVHHLISALPLVRSASLARLAFLVVAAVAILAAFGVDALTRPCDRVARARITTVSCVAVLAVVVAVIVFIEWQHAFLSRNALSAFVREASLASVVIAVAAAAVILLRSAVSRSPSRLAALALAAIVTSELSSSPAGFIL